MGFPALPGHDVQQLCVNGEFPVEGDATTNLEAVVAIDWAKFSYDFPKTDIEITWLLFLGLTDLGRYRVDLDARFDRELCNASLRARSPRRSDPRFPRCRTPVLLPLLQQPPAF